MFFEEGLHVEVEHLSKPWLWKGCLGKCDVCQLKNPKDEGPYQQAIDEMAELWYQGSDYLATKCAMVRAEKGISEDNDDADRS